METKHFPRWVSSPHAYFFHKFLFFLFLLKFFLNIEIDSVQESMREDSSACQEKEHHVWKSRKHWGETTTLPSAVSYETCSLLGKGKWEREAFVTSSSIPGCLPGSAFPPTLPSPSPLNLRILHTVLRPSPTASLPPYQTAPQMVGLTHLPPAWIQRFIKESGRGRSTIRISHVQCIQSRLTRQVLNEKWETKTRLPSSFGGI